MACRMRMIALAIVMAMFLPPHHVRAYDYGNDVFLCNKGDIDIYFLAFATKNTLLGGHKAKISAWHKIEPRDCVDASLSGYTTLAVGFQQTNNNGVRGNPVYVLENATDIGSTDWAPGVLCAPIKTRLVDESGFGVIRDRYQPPCKEGFAEFRMSFGSIPNGNGPTFNLKAKGSDRLFPWAVGVAATPPSASTQQEDTMSNAEVAAKIFIGAAQGLEKGKIRKLAGVCEKSVLAFAFSFSKEGPARACECIGRNVVRNESPGVVSAMIADIDADRGFDAAFNRLSEANLERYMESCVTPAD